MAVDLTDIDKIDIKNVSTGKMEKLEELWTNKTCVIIFFRRWGCLYCRHWAKEVSQIANILKGNNIRLIGIGPEELGVQEFIDGKFFDGVWTPNELSVEKILKDDEFWAKQIEKPLWQFIFKCVLPELVDPRCPRGLPIRDRFYKLKLGCETQFEVYVDEGKKVYSKIGYKRYNYFSILWYVFTRSRENKQKDKASNLGWNLQGDWLQIGGALIVEKGGKILQSYRQEGAADQLSNEKILEVLDLAAEFKTRSLDKDFEADDSEASELN